MTPLTDAELDWLQERLLNLAPRVDDITGPSSVVEIEAAKALRDAASAIRSLRTETVAAVAELARVREALERIADDASFDTELELKVFARIALAAGKGEGEKHD